MYADFHLSNIEKINYNKDGLAAKPHSDTVREMWVEERAEVKVKARQLQNFMHYMFI